MKKVSIFTLIELLVAISIIAILMSFLLPGLRKAKDYSNELGCKSNLRQLYLAWLNYVSDNDNKAPLYYDPASEATWASVLHTNGYVKQPGYGQMVERCKKGGLFICPSYAYDNYALYAHTEYKYFVYNYTLYTGIGGNGWARLKYPSKTMLLCDKGDQNATSYRIDAFSLIAKNEPPILSIRHSGGLNLVFGDGHTENHKGSMPVPLPTVSNEWPWFSNQF